MRSLLAVVGALCLGGCSQPHADTRGITDPSGNHFKLMRSYTDAQGAHCEDYASNDLLVTACDQANFKNHRP